MGMRGRMSAVLKPRCQFTPEEMERIEAACYAARTEHDYRLDAATDVPIRRRGRRVKKRPRTALLVAMLKGVDNRGTTTLLSLLKAPK
jgi:hypothetical protein